MTPATCQLLERHLRLPVADTIMLVDLFAVIDATGTYSVSDNPVSCPYNFSTESSFPSHHI